MVAAAAPCATRAPHAMQVHVLHGTLWRPDDGYGYAWRPATQRLWLATWQAAVKALADAAAQDAAEGGASGAAARAAGAGASGGGQDEVDAMNRRWCADQEGEAAADPQRATPEAAAAAAAAVRTRCAWRAARAWSWGCGDGRIEACVACPDSDAECWFACLV